MKVALIILAFFAVELAIAAVVGLTLRKRDER
jgi:hypothetical protein